MSCSCCCRSTTPSSRSTPTRSRRPRIWARRLAHALARGHPARQARHRLGLRHGVHAVGGLDHGAEPAGLARLALVHRDHPAMDVRGQDWNTGSAYAFLLLLLCTVFVTHDDAALPRAAGGHRASEAGRHERRTRSAASLHPRSMSVIFFAYMLAAAGHHGRRGAQRFPLPLGLSLGRLDRSLVRRAVERRADVERGRATRCWWRSPWSSISRARSARPPPS